MSKYAPLWTWIKANGEDRFKLTFVKIEQIAGVIAIIKVINIISRYVIKKQFVSIHTAANKLTGLLLFLFPISATVIDIIHSTIVVCMAATFAAIQEGYLIKSKKNLRFKDDDPEIMTAQLFRKYGKTKSYLRLYYFPMRSHYFFKLVTNERKVVFSPFAMMYRWIP